jgi:hypothetical protein
MTIIATAAPKFHSLTGTQPVGQTQVAVASEYAGTVTTVTRGNESYWSVNVRDARNAFAPGWGDRGKTCAIWCDGLTGAYVVDYWGGKWGDDAIEADRTRSLKAAIGVAVTVAAQRWLVSR